MNDDKEKTVQTPEPGTQPQTGETLHLKNPFNPSEEVDITPDDIEKEQEFKEAQTERD